MTASEILAIAQAEVGYREKASNSNLDSKTGNSGGNNWTKYARDLANAGFFNGNKNGYPWCAVFVTWCAWQACGKNRTEAMRVLCQSGVYGAGCTQAAQYYRDAGRLDNVPHRGDQVFFGTRTDEEHTGIVEYVDGYIIHTIEGNGSGAGADMVARHNYDRRYTHMQFGHPRFDAEGGTTKKTEEGKIMVALDEISKGSVGAQVKTVQRLLIAQGYDCGGYGDDGEFGSGTDSSVRAYQRAHGLDVDGIVGQNTWTKLLRG